MAYTADSKSAASDGLRVQVPLPAIDVAFSVVPAIAKGVSSPCEVPMMPELPPFSIMDTAFRGRDESFDGLFFAAVTTTGIFCRPSCPARKPLPGNTVYYATAAEALCAGYRPCQRCKPLASSVDPDWALDLLERVEASPERRIRDSDLRAEGLDPATVRRRFQARYGLSFQAYQRARRLAAAFEAIKAGGSLDDAVFDHGYESHSGFRDAFARLFGEAPGRASKAAGGDFIRLAWIDGPLGPIVAGAVDAGICLLEFTDRRMLEAQAETLRSRLGLPAAPAPHPHLERLEAELGEYFAGKRQGVRRPGPRAGNALPGEGLAGPARDTVRRDAQLRRARARVRRSRGRARGGAGERPEPDRDTGALPPRHRRGRRLRRLRRRGLAQAPAPRDRGRCPLVTEPACRPGCAACCIAPSMSSPIPGMPRGKRAGEACVQLTEQGLCALFGKPERPGGLRLAPSFARDVRLNREEALAYLSALESSTAP